MDTWEHHIENWLSEIVAKASPTGKTLPATPTTSRRGSPRKRNRFNHDHNNNDDDDDDDDVFRLPARPAVADPDATPVASSRMPPLTTDDSARHLSSTSSAASGKSQSVSPQKREFGLRRAADYPVVRQSIGALRRDACKSLGSFDIHSLLRDLHAIKGEENIIPDIFKAEMESDPMSEPPRRHWFYPTPRDDADNSIVNERLLRYRHDRLREIAEDADALETQLVSYEPEWNELVHGPILKLAFSGHSSLGARNVTVVRVAKPFRERAESTTTITESKIDYAVFSSLSSSSSSTTSAFHEAQPSFTTLEDPRAWIVSIETKSLTHDHVEGPVQLAKWARAHLRWLEYVVTTTTTAIMKSQQQEDPARALQDLYLPLVFIFGNTWEVSFAVRRGGKTVIYSHLPLGNTSTLAGCYQVCKAMRCLGEWAGAQMGAWWGKIAAVG